MTYKILKYFWGLFSLKNRRLRLDVLLNRSGFLTSKLFLEVYNEISSKGRSKFTTRMILIIHKEKNLHSTSCWMLEPIIQKGYEISVFKYFKAGLDEVLSD